MPVLVQQVRGQADQSPNDHWAHGHENYFSSGMVQNIFDDSNFFVAFTTFNIYF